MNKTQLVDALAERLGDRRTAAAAVDGLLETIVDRVRSGEQVALTGFGVFEGRARAARTARNPRTGVAVAVPATTVPAFRPGAGFRAAVGSAAQSNGSAPASVVAEPATEAPVKNGKNGKAAKGGKAKEDKAGGGKGAKAKKAKSKK
ncbi:HU family DNA-binding protein [Pseudonocardia cypriaca]|uniref:DNA-binding protein HU-beta n=1 Tax=Pseudonocardia cypriaca TaxID=882449 RepID=A0A543GAG0_9PSEU|nr:DNA-binding protein HU-beta [Pseudonocardia cypriaca]